MSRSMHRAALCVGQRSIMSAQHTTISLAESTRNELFRLKQEPEETYDDVVRSLLDERE